jgi:hypothetical protein
MGPNYMLPNNRAHLLDKTCELTHNFAGAARVHHAAKRGRLHPDVIDYLPQVTLTLADTSFMVSLI